MSPNDIKHIVNCVVDYYWPWQVGYTSLYHTGIDWQPPINGDIYTLLADLSMEMPVRLDPTHEHNWPIETREGMPCWVDDRVERKWQHVLGISHAREAGIIYAYCVAPHPLNPTMEPPSGWVPEGKRILK